MPTLTDTRFEVLRSLGYEGATSDMLLQFLRDQIVPPAQLAVRSGRNAGLSNTVTQPVYIFNGLTMWATFPEWKPLGLPYEYSFNAAMLEPNSGAVQNYISAVGNLPQVRVNPSNTRQSRNELVAGGGLGTNVGPPEIQTVEAHHIEVSPGKMVYTADASQNTASEDFKSSDLTNGFSSIAGDPTGNGLSNMFMYAFRLTDNAPLQNRWVMEGDRIRFAAIANDIVLPAVDGWEIEFDLIYNPPDSGADRIAGDSTNNNRITVNGATAGTPNAFQLRIDGTFGPAITLFDKVAYGQHVNIRVVHPAGGGNLQEVYLDGVLADSRNTNSVLNDFLFNELYGAGGLPINTGGAMGNLRLTNLTTGDQWFWPIDEETGGVAENTDPSTQGTDYDATWTDSAGRQFVKDNSRLYQMDEGTGNVFECVDGLGDAQPGLNATIQGFDEANWREAIADPQTIPDAWKTYLFSVLSPNIAPEVWADPPDALTNGWVDEGNGRYFVDNVSGANAQLQTFAFSGNPALGSRWRFRFQLEDLDSNDPENLDPLLRIVLSSAVVYECRRTGWFDFEAEVTDSDGFGWTFRAPNTVIARVSNISVTEVAPGLVQNDEYHRNDWWYMYLGTLGYEGNMNDRELQFWQSFLTPPDPPAGFSSGFSTGFEGGV